MRSKHTTLASVAAAPSLVAVRIGLGSGHTARPSRGKYSKQEKKTMCGNENSSWSKDRHRKMEMYGYLLMSITMFVPMKQLYGNHCDEPVCKFYKKCFL